MLYCVLYVYQSIMQGSLEVPLPWLVPMVHLRVFTTITITITTIVIIIIIAKIS